jgi:hypothetical protein
MHYTSNPHPLLLHPLDALIARNIPASTVTQRILFHKWHGDMP